MVKYKDIVKLMQKSRERKKTGLYVVEGPKMVMEAVGMGLAVKVLLTESLAFSDKTGIIAGLQNTEYEVISDKKYKEFTQTVTPQGILAVVKMSEHTAQEITENGRRILILENIQDPGNLGTMLRTVEASGFDGILMNKGTADIYNPKVVRSTMGAIFRVPFVYCDDINNIFDLCKRNKISIYGAALGGEDIRKTVFEDRLAFVIGNESAGITDETLKCCDRQIKIPMAGNVESLNASVAAGILMYLSNLSFL